MQRHVEELALAGALPFLQRHQDADRGVEAGRDVDDRAPMRIGPVSGVPLIDISPVMAWRTAS